MAFWLREDGAAAVEFVIILPIMLSVVALVTVISQLFIISTDIQQTTFELARKSVQFAQVGRNTSQICSDLKSRYSNAEIAQLSSFLSAGSIKSMTCTGRNNEFIEVSLTYDLSGQSLIGLGEFAGVSITSLTRKSVIGL